MSKKKEIIIDVRDLKMRYGMTDVLKGVTFSVTKGEVLALLGPNGAGKSTTIEIMEGFRKRSAGTVRILGVDPIMGDEAWRARIGVVLQSWRDHSRWKVCELLEHLGLYYEPYTLPDRKRPVDTNELLEIVGLQAHAHKRAGSLSGGQRRRLDVAIGLVGNPELLFLDEPTVGFDPKARRDFHEVIHRLSRVQDTTILLTTHDLDEAEKLSDRIVILAGGKIVANGSADQLAKEVSSRTEVQWTQHKKRHVHITEDATTFTRQLLASHPDDISDLEIRRGTLEDTYIHILQQYEAAQIQQDREDGL